MDEAFARTESCSVEYKYEVQHAATIATNSTVFLIDPLPKNDFTCNIDVHNIQNKQVMGQMTLIKQ
jgi:hypothetical protein